MIEGKQGLRVLPSQAGGRTLSPRGVATLGPAAAAPQVPFDVQYYGLDLTPEFGPHPPGVYPTVSGTATLLVEVTAAGLTDIVLDAVKFDVSEVLVNGAPRPFSMPDTATLSIQVGSAAAGDTVRNAGDLLWVAIHYTAHPDRGYYGFSRVTYTFTEPQGARYWFPCVDAPRDKATYEGWYTVPDTVYCASNGVLEDVAPAGAMRRWHWRESHPIATYLICITMSNFAEMHDSADGLPLLYLTFPEDTTKARYDFGRLPEMVRFLSTTFEPYPFDKYGMAAVEPFFNIGGMEHQTLTTINRIWIRGDRYFESGYLHELSHQWFGDSATPTTWQEIWLNEGFASYCEALWAEHTEGASGRDSWLASAASSFFVEFAHARYPVSNPPPDYLFGEAIYLKGAWILHMLRHEIGDADFFAVLRQHLAEGRYGNVTIARFRQIASEVSGRDLTSFFDQWLDGIGYPVLEYAFSACPAASGAAPWTATVYVRQTQQSIGGDLFHVPLEVALSTGTGDRRFTVQLTGAVEDSFVFELDAMPTGMTLDPDLWLLKRVTPRSTFVEAGPEPSGVRVEGVYPNPAHGAAVVQFRVPHLGPQSTQGGQTQPLGVRADLYDVRGRKVRVLADSAFGPGVYRIGLDGRDGHGARLAAGVYLIRVSSAAGSDMRRIVYLP